MGFGAPLLGPVQLSLSLPAEDKNTTRRHGSKVRGGHFVGHVGHVLLTSARRRRTSGSPECSPPAPRCCICAGRHDGSGVSLRANDYLQILYSINTRTVACSVLTPASFGKLTRPSRDTRQRAAGSKPVRDKISDLLRRPAFPLHQVLAPTLQKHTETATLARSALLHSTGVVSYSAPWEKRAPSLTFLILRLMSDSAANTRSPTADSSMFLLRGANRPASWLLLSRTFKSQPL